MSFREDMKVTKARLTRLFLGSGLGTEVTATAAEINAVADGDNSYVDVTDAATYSVLAANSKKLHIMPDLTADCVLSLPAAADGLDFEFIYKGVAADAHDWQFDTGSDTNFFLGGFVELDTTAATVTLEAPDGNSNSIMNILTPAPGTRIRMVCDGTNWILSGTVHSETADAVTWADQ